MRALLIAGFVTALSTEAAAAEWDCSNQGIAEIQCTAIDCDIMTDAFPPLRASVSAEDIEVCAYSGCFSGATQLAEHNESHFIYSASVRRTDRESPVEAPDQVSVIVDGDKVGVLRWRAFAIPVRCELKVPSYYRVLRDSGAKRASELKW